MSAVFGKIPKPEKEYIPCSVRQAAANLNGHRRVIYSIKPNKAYYDAKQYDSKTKLFPFTTGSKYIGHWENNKKSGFGRFTMNNGDIYEGEFNADQKHGKGTYWIKKTVKDAATGKKKSTHRKLYSGEWKNDLKSGYGVLFFDDKATNENKNDPSTPLRSEYEGTFSQDQMNGSGKITYKNGDNYEGGWMNNKRSGVGIYTIASSGDVYEGSWLNDLKDGPGRYHYKSTGKVYVGEWSMGVAKCGMLQDEEINTFNKDTVEEEYDLPELQVKQPEKIFNKAVVEVRQKRLEETTQTKNAIFGGDIKKVTETTEDEGPLFTPEQLKFLEEIYTETSDKSGYILPFQIIPILFQLEIYPGEYQRQLEESSTSDEKAKDAIYEQIYEHNKNWLVKLFNEIGGSYDSTAIYFADFIDIVALAIQKASI